MTATAEETLAVIEFLWHRTFDLQEEIDARGIDYSLQPEAHWLITARNAVTDASHGFFPEKWIQLHYEDAVKRAAEWSDHPDYQKAWAL